MRVLGVDLGARRIGLALSDPSGTLATPLRVIERTGDDARDLQAVVDAARDEGASRIVVGLPRSLSGASGPAAAHAEHEIAVLRSLADADDVVVEAHDERFTTVIAQRRLREGGSRRDSTPVDAAAAAEILQSYLDAAARRTARGGRAR
jgi:putative Holliday junction resolvase